MNTFRAFADCLIFVAMSIIATIIVRLVFIFNFINFDVFANNVEHVPLLLLNAFRFDLQIATYCVLPLFLLALIQIFCGSRFSQFREKYSKWFSPIIITIVTIIGFADIQFYKNFNSHFNNVTFDFFDEEPSILIKGIVNEAPIFKILFGTIVIFIAIFLIHKLLIGRILKFPSKIKRVTTIVICVLVIPIGMRGSLGTFTLRAEDIYVSTSNEMNACVPNAIFMMKKAWSEKKKQFKLEDESTILSASGFKNIEEAAEVLGYDTNNLDSMLYEHTIKNAPLENYNVVLILTESWSNRLIEIERLYNQDFLASMRQHTQDDIFFRHFLSSENGTIDAVEAITVNAIHPHLFTSAYRDIEYPCASARLFANNGYETSFISGIEISWRNLIEVLPHQGFDNVVGKFEMLNKMPDAECNRTWGVYDHEMLRFVLNKLNEPSSKPQFMLCLTSTSHTPFEFPQNYDLPQIDIDKIPEITFSTTSDITIEYLKGFQYESRALGDFISALKSSDAAKNTIVAITGDHNVRQILNYNGVDDWWKYSVPLYLYIPNAMRDSIHIDTERFGSHNDIIPTLANLTLSDAIYFNSGNNLFADSIPDGTMSINSEYTMSASNADIEKLMSKANARKALKTIYFERIFKDSKKKN